MVEPHVAQERLVDLQVAFARELDAALVPFTLEVRRAVVDRFARLAAAAVADPLLVQLVREAYDHFQNPESEVDIREWLKTAEQFMVRR